ncbi:MAG: synthase subunit [Lachnospiraceae bacterium]|jgi:trk system potassium uptake protein TrkH|nr:synthase subunit [Lachnospiraceae bacterium]
MLSVLKTKLTYAQFIALGYLLIILLGGLFLSLPIASRSGEWTPYINSLFTATSATCVTGLVVYDTFTHWSLFGQLTILSLIQIGGVGFMTIITLFSMFLKRHIGLHERRLLMQSAGTLEVGGIVRLIRRIAIGTLVFEGAGALFLATRFVPDMGLVKGVYNAVFHSVSAFCNAGFDLMGRFGQYSSLTTYADDIIVNITIMLLIVIGGIGFLVWNDIIKCGFRFKKFQLHTKIVLVSTGMLILSGAILFFIFEYNASFSALNMKDKIMAAFFQSITPRTAGYNTIDLAALSESGNLLTMMLMFIGGSPGSTAGGIKTTTFVVLLMGTIASSRHNANINIFKRRMDEDVVKQASAIATIYLLAVLGSTLIIAALQPFSVKQVLFEVISAAATVGLTTGITTSLNFVSRIIIILLMYGGRVGILTLALVLAEKRENVLINRPIEKILIG